ncbi:MFS transporter [Bifidobacterium amazonense]|uniref:MFS transporter n=1 Tax=Bifidobacterium amazonense TaxID=2809027 RepID=A0ABS9VYU8_9BIFI|nr:MFS transporter [Bifidobacterium amazonense]MCH9277091.1 MFS transporter [Bifidobacterium amazonense]
MSDPTATSTATSTTATSTTHSATDQTTDQTTTPSPLRSRDFALLIAGQGISLFGDSMLGFAMAMWVLDRTGSATVFASILAAAVVPTIICSPFGGVLADRMNRRTIMVALDAGSSVIVAVSAIVFATAGFHIAAVAVMQILLAVLKAFETPTVQAAIPQMYRRYGEETVRQATAVTNQVQMLSNLLPSFLGGVLYSALGIRAMMLITVVSFAAAAVLERFIRLGAPERDGELPSPLDDFKAGLRFLLHDRPNVFKLALFAAGLNFVVIGYANVGVAYTIRTVLGFDATVYGVADGLVGVAGVAGAMLAGMFAAKLSMDRMPAALVAFTLTILPQGLVFLLPVGAWTKLVVMVAFECASMVCCCFTNLIAAPAIQLSTPEAMTGKVMSIFGALCICAQPLGQMAYGWAYDRFPVAAILLVTTAICGVVTAMMTPFSRRFDE